jgi:NAD(P)-dependent dehydrogenase (short-subunit alcohol dehydrogenase family)
LFSNPGQSNYGAAKTGIATFSQICAKELSRYNVKSNSIAPAARTRLTLATPGLEERIAAPQDDNAFDEWDPANISPLVAYLSSADCAFSGETFFVKGGEVTRVKSWELAETVDAGKYWSVADLSAAMKNMSSTIK